MSMYFSCFIRALFLTSVLQFEIQPVPIRIWTGVKEYVMVGKWDESHKGRTVIIY